MKDMIKTAIIVLHYENEQLTNQCVDSIFEHTEKGVYHIVIVDNNSPTVYSREKDDRITIIRNNTRESVSGMNFGFYHALYNLPFNIEYVVNFDSDIICLSNWLPPLIDVMERNKKCGIVTGKQWDKEMTKYGSVGVDLMGVTHRNLPETECNVLWAQGSFHMYRAEMMHRIGLHDDRYKTICSDSDYCIHAVDRGWHVVFNPASEVIHIGNASYGKDDEVYHDNNAEDKIEFTQKWFGIKFCKIFNENFKFDLISTIDINVTYEINDRKTTFMANADSTRPSTKRIKEYFKDKEIVGAEIGSLLGFNASSMLKHLPTLNKLYLVDNNTDEGLIVLKNKFMTNSKVVIVESDSVAAASKFDDQSLDYVYIDADHSYEAVKADIEAWLPKIKPDGIICGHDYFEHEEFGVIKAVNEIFKTKSVYVEGIDWMVYMKENDHE